MANPGPAKTMISPVSTISLVAVIFSWSTYTMVFRTRKSMSP